MNSLSSRPINCVRTDKGSGRHEGASRDHVGMPDETKSKGRLFGAKIVQAAAGRGSSNIAIRQRRQRRVNNRNSFSFSSEAFEGVRMTHRYQKEVQLLALQLPFLEVSESMGNHDSKIVDAGSVD